jgi:hypothetical protein
MQNSTLAGAGAGTIEILLMQVKIIPNAPRRKIRAKLSNNFLLAN